MMSTLALLLMALSAVSSSVVTESESRPSGLKMGIVHKPESCPRKAKYGDVLSMHYNATRLEDGSKLDSSLDRNEPFRFLLGIREVFPGWNEAVLGMCVSERRFLIAPVLASRLRVDVELLAIEKEDHTPVDAIDRDADGSISWEELNRFLHRLEQATAIRSSRPTAASSAGSGRFRWYVVVEKVVTFCCLISILSWFVLILSALGAIGRFWVFWDEIRRGRRSRRR